MGQIIVGGRPIEVGVPVRTWHDVPGLAFPALGKRRETKAVVLHHTGGEGDSAQVHRTLVQRGLSVHFTIDRELLITQHCDADRLCAHAKGYNVASIGIEIVNAAGKTAGTYGRPVLRENVHGRDIVQAGFLPAQITAALALVKVLCAAHGLPLSVPMRGRDVLSTVMDQQEMADFRGVCGHLNVDRQKVDPPLMMLRAVAALPLRGKDGAAE